MNILAFIFSTFLMLYGESTNSSSMLCMQQGTLAFVQHRHEADIAIRFVQSNENVRISFHRNRAFRNGMWRIVAKTEQPDIKVFIDTFPRNDTIDVKIVDYNPGCVNISH